MAMDNLHGLFVEELKDLYSAENQILKALPKMAKGATHPDLKAAFAEHLEVTKGHVARLEKIFQSVDATAKGKKCVAMEGLIEESKELLELKSEADPAVFDAALIGAAQRVEHYEMAGYGCVRTFARLLGLTEAQNLLQETLDEEGEADEKLGALADAVINPAAQKADEEGKAPREANENGTKRGRENVTAKANENGAGKKKTMGG